MTIVLRQAAGRTPAQESEKPHAHNRRPPRRVNYDMGHPAAVASLTFKIK
jgi:hypothetical protein